MKTLAKRMITLVLCLLMLVPSIVSCKKEEAGVEDESTTAGEVATSEDVTEDKYAVYDDLGELDFGGRAITIAQPEVSYYKNEVLVERLTGDVVNDAIYKRNQSVNKRLNIQLKNVFIGNGVYSVLKDLEAGRIAGTVTYDLILNPVYSTAAYTTRSLYHDLKTVDNLDLDKVYWSDYVNDALEIGGVQYIASGAVSLSFYKFLFVTLVNNNMLAENKNGVPDLMQVVKDGKWTLEYQHVLASQYYTDNGVSGKDEEDIFGLVTSDMLGIDPYMASCEITVLKKGADGFYTYDFDLERASGVVDKVIGLFNDNGTFCFRYDGSHETANGEQIEIAKKFASGEALMSTLRLIELEDSSIRNMKDVYNILPMPRYSEDQTGYYSLVSDRFTGMAMPITVKEADKEVMGAVMEALASESYRTVTPAYYEIVLKTRYMDNADGWEMMDMITENVKMDAVLPYTAALEVDGSTIIKRFRNIISKSYRTGATPEVASTFTTDLATKMNNKLNGDDGLQTYIREQLSAQ